MSYISPIKIEKISQMEEGWADKIGKYIAGEVDNLVLESCVKVGCHVDKDELEKALRYDRGQYIKGYEDGKRDAASPWRRVEDELPRYGQDVLAARLYGADVDGWAYEIVIAHVCEVRGTNYWNATNITHWMPLPEPPQEEK